MHTQFIAAPERPEGQEMNDRTSPAESKVGETAHERAALLDRAEAIVVDAIKRMRAAHVHCQDLLHDVEAFMEDKAPAASATETEGEGTCAQCRKPSITNQTRASDTDATARTKVAPHSGH
ncbi:hypothetical protein WL68_19215 [Burkholderia cepacia]|uniref:hypothetical protein n=1 Tax=Burkholderia cepacia TaxID=292 RepID=UPI0007551CB5|nr:hypothetical protein [Burkholderia cepacia]KWD62334.1 hypothetical protein WL68_19215 [Burkholderia cepacia]KWD74662.1 hypothetical protein WL69_28820 [Burkholderia cepacia]